ncbi:MULTISPECIES: hypothetical protein [unclassified Serratia (in: enterobacteria)]|nr:MULTISPECIES: hypothetical protein [unclassified Serratia (in: enterobacteria)]AGE16140.1 hypothetical protein SMWW4_v1c03330 [Serratia marcescens WW4]BEN47531.1 hypothetical protein SMKC056_44770 [Serratia marcescens]BEO16339.1 hypothetical protein SMQC17_43690 [Serratia marcescens]BEO78595.1 hypothetical protein SMTE4_45650 [Serratia marcescens]
MLKGRIKLRFILALKVGALLFFPISAIADWKTAAEVEIIPPNSPGQGPAVQGIWHVYINQWDTNDLRPNPMYGCNSCALHLRYRLPWWGSGHDAQVFADTGGWLSNSKTLGEVALGAQQQGLVGPNATRYLVRSVSGWGLCAYLAYSDHAVIKGTILGGAIDANRYPACEAPVVHPTQCNIREPQVDIRHGLVAPDKVNGSQASAQITVWCNETLPVRIVAAEANATDFISLSKASNFRSIVTINGSPFSKGAFIDAGSAGTKVNLTSTLANYSGEVGDFQGSATIVVSIQ